MSLKSTRLLMSMLLGSMAMDEPSNAGNDPMSSDSPDRSSDMPDNPLVSALSSNLNAAWMASPSMVNSDCISKPSPSSSSPNGLSVNTLVSGWASWSFTMVLLAACSIT